MAIADTSFIIAFFDRTDRRHDETRVAFEKADHVLISTEVLVETFGVVKARAGRGAAQTVLRDLMRLENVGWEEHCDIAAVFRICEEEPTLSFPDAVGIHNSLRTGQDLWTYDVRQRKVLEKRTGKGARRRITKD